MPSKNTKVITLRVPDRVDFGDVNLHKFVTNLYDMVQCGAIEIVDNELVMPERAEEIDLDSFYEVCRARNIDPQKGIDRCVQMMWR